MGKLRFRQVHLDFHTSEQIEGVGDKFDPREFAEVLKDAGVDSITCFARCHHGMIYYDTDFPGRHPHLHRNLLREQIDACHAAGIKVPWAGTNLPPKTIRNGWNAARKANPTAAAPWKPGGGNYASIRPMRTMWKSKPSMC